MNKTQVRQDALDSAIVYAINEALDERVLEASVAAALERLGQKGSVPRPTNTAEREPSLIQTRLHRLVD